MTEHTISVGNGVGQRVAYVRVSSADQSLERQIQDLQSVAPARIFADTTSARSRAGRPGLEECLRYVREGDELHVTSIDRMARSLVDLHNLLEEFNGKGVNVTFHRENLWFAADASDPRSTLMLGILGSFAEFERAIIRERQAEGIRIAKKAGKYKGRAKALRKDQVEEAQRRIASGESKAAVARDFQISRTTLYKYLSG